MIDPVSDLLPLALAGVIVLLAIMQPTYERMMAGAWFALLGLLHFMLFYAWVFAFGEKMDGITYFVTAAITSGIAIELMMRIPKVVSTTISLYRVCIAEIAANSVALALWYYDQSPLINTYVFLVLRIWAISILLRKDTADDVGGYTITSRWDYFTFVLGTRRIGLDKGESSS